MPGGILQLVATGKENEALTVEPQITMFKTVYRRHVNFDKYEYKLLFNNELNFGMSSTCIIKKMADLISAMCIMIELPKIDISYLPLTNEQLYLLLKDYGITWTFDKEDMNVLITQAEFEEVVGKLEYISGKLVRLTDGMINEQVANLSRTVSKDNDFMQVIQETTNKYINDNNTNVSEYLNELMLNLLLTNRNLFITNETYIDEYDYYNEYLYLYSYQKDLSSLIPQVVSWQDATTELHQIISFYNPSVGLPSQVSEDRYICSNADRGWNLNSIYRWYVDPSLVLGNWTETIPLIGYGAHLQFGFNNLDAITLYECTGFTKLVNGLYDPNINGLPLNPVVGDKYICTTDYTIDLSWKKNNIYTWTGTEWSETQPTYGNALFVTGYGNDSYQSYYQRLVYFDNNTWTIYSPEMTVIFDKYNWHKSVISFFDPTNGLPSVSIPDSIGNTYICSASSHGWTINYMYIWDGWEWVEKIPTENFGVYVEGGDTFSQSIIVFNGSLWKVLTLPLPLYNFSTFKKLVYDTLRDIIFTDTNIELLYAVENCNTTVIPSNAILPIKTFFDNIITNEIGTIDTNSAVYKSVYDTFFDDSLVGTLAHVLSVQLSLSTAIRSEINDVINPNIQMMTTMYGRLQFVDASAPDYYRFNYYKYYPHNGTSYDTTQSLVNCPRDYYATLSALRDFFASYLINISYTTDYITEMKNIVYNLVGNATSSINGTLYDALIADSRITSMFDNYFTNTSSSYETVQNSILLDPFGTSGNRKMFNLPSCINVLSTYAGGQSIQTNLVLDYTNFSLALTYTLSTKGAYWNTQILNIINYINDNIPIIDTIIFPTSLWNSTDGFLSKMSSDPNSYDRLVSFIFRYFTQYDVYKLLPVDYSFVPDFVIPNKNPIEYLILTFSTNLVQFITYQNDKVESSYKLSSSELSDLTTKITYIGNAYLDLGLQTYSDFSVHQTNILSSTVPELFIPEVPVFENYHLPYDGITSMTCYLLNTMKALFNTCFQSLTQQDVYDDLGNPFMNANEQFVTNSDFYTYGNQMYINGFDMINGMIDIYLNDMTRYDKYGNTLKIKNLYLEQINYTYAYPLEMFIEIHKAIYNNQHIYINLTLSDYDDTYTTILSELNDQIAPLLQFAGNNGGVYMGPMDVLMTSLDVRTSPSYINPYDPDVDTIRYNWYNDKIVSVLLDYEVDFDPSPIGIIEYFLSTINSSTNPFSPTTYLYQWYENIDRTKVTYEITKMYKLFGLPYYSTNAYSQEALTPISLYNDIGNINSKYDSFSDITDFLSYMLDHVIIWSQLGNIVPLFKATIQATNDVLINYYNTEKSTSLNLISKIEPYTLTSVNGSVIYSNLEDIVRNIYNKKPVNFAWVREIGHYIIDNIQLVIGDTVIDQYPGEYLHLIQNTEGSFDKYRGYKHMIGDIEELTTFNNTTKQKYMLYIPVMFTFSKFYECALPLMCMHFTDVSLRVKLKNFNDVAYWAPMTQFNKKPKLNCAVIAEYIYLDHEERFRMAPLKHEILTETIQYNGDVTVDLSKSDTATIRLNFSGVSKELYIVCQMDECVDGSLPNGEKQWNNYMIKVPRNETDADGNINVTYATVNPIQSMYIDYNGRQRETNKEIQFYSLLQRITHHRLSINDGISIYCFALYPQTLQPSGNANLGKIGYVDLVITFRPDVVALVGSNKKTLRVGVYNKSINFLRVMSGLAGLAFYN